ncbi:PAS domain-containing sensor histidine kinase [Mucilaginibacter ginkgonis]|uniref:histidine kinase n=1 Tax=Mucilaginibacter ginkgonis TaxID=2682091 RepID=A0A6I4HW99_9SPHI|nr:sensor histidine kinase [Mucilaginibacter ginkgonis]QQL51226.1 hypothetical protein GO620_007200 [Mucilaginibacter ginkgonis]
MAPTPDSVAIEILDTIAVACFKLDGEGRLIYISKEARQSLSEFGSVQIGAKLLDSFPLYYGTPVPDLLEEVKNTGKSLSCEYISPYDHFWMSIAVHRVDNNGLIVYFSEIEKAKGTQKELLSEQEKLHANRNLLRATLDGSLNFTQVFEAIRNNNHKIINFKWLLQNNVSKESSGHVIGKLLLDENPGVIDTGFFDRMIAVTESGESCQYELEYNHEQFNGWYHHSIIKLADGVVVSSTDITARKLAEEKLLDANDLLQSVFDTSLLAISVMDAVYDEEGNITDFRIKVANAELEKQTNRKDLVGKLYSVEYPGIKQMGIYDTILRVMDTGRSEGFDYFYPFEGINRWFACMFVKMGSSIIATNLDVTNIKNAEFEKLKILNLLEQTEELAMIGSWDYELAGKVMTWSEGMYRLFNLEKTATLSPEVFVTYVTPYNTYVTRRIIKYINSGLGPFDETIDFKIGKSKKTLRLKADVVRNLNGDVERVLGVTLDITAGKLAREKTKKLVKEQKALELEKQQQIFKAIITTQEEERKRIAESLHNGLGQVLYGVKLSLNQLKFGTDNNVVDNIKTVRQTENLLMDAISESRRLSHELMPKLLEDFGLKAAFEDMAEQFETSIGLFLQFNGPDNFRIDPFMELAIYRMIQEVILNVVKHAAASITKLNVEITTKKMTVLVKDNGKGFDVNQSGGDGIGLTSLRNNLKLLNGSLQLTSGLDMGTQVVLEFPIQF